MEKEVIGELIGEQLPLNRTGLMLNPELGCELIRGAKETVPSSRGDGEEMKMERAEYAQEGLLIGSYPSAATESVMEAELESADEPMAILLDKLGERLAFERQGTRLYEAFLEKVEAMSIEEPNAPTTDDLRHICEEELEHFKLLQQAIVKLGGDATVQTPSADVAGVLSHGALQIMSDPRTTIAQALQAALNAELVDNDGWKMLQELSKQLEHADLAEQCAKAYEEEQEHLANVRTWLSNMILSEAGGEEALTDGEEKEKRSKTSSRSAAKKKASRGNKRRKK